MNIDDRATTRTAVAVALLLTVAGLGAAGFTLAAPDGPTGETVLNQTEQRYAEAETLTVEATVTVSNESATKTASVSAVATDENRSRVIVESDNRSLITGTNGTAAWTFVPTTGTVTVYQNDTATTIGPLGNTTTRELDGEKPAGEYNYSEPTEPVEMDWNESDRSVELVETTSYEDTEVHVVSITHANESVDGEARLWIRTADSVVVKQRVTTPNATVVVDVAETRFNVSVADSTFQPPTADDGAAGLAPVDSTDALDAAVSFDAVALADGAFTFERGVVSRFGGTDGATAVSRYTNGSATVTLVQTDASSLPAGTANAPDEDLASDTVSTENVTVDGRAVTVATREDRVVAWWESEDTTIAVTGEIPRNRLIELVEATAPVAE
jgi:outer membrane lipoprotein-sorting protein